jgi:hypothetical protein
MITKPFTGIPAPNFLPDDPWFGNAIYSKKQQENMIAELVKERLIIVEETPCKEVDNIHEVMYNFSTQWKLHMGGGSENIWN